MCWQPVEAGEEEEAREQTEREEEILNALRALQKARAVTVANWIGKDPSNIHKRLVELWKAGKCKREVVDSKPYYFIENQEGNTVNA